MRIRVDKSSAVPYYHQIKEAVRALIAQGHLKTGDMLPTEVSLSEQLVGHAVFKGFLGVTPGTAATCHGNCQEESDNNASDQNSTQRFRAEDKTNKDRSQDREKGRNHHLLDG